MDPDTRPLEGRVEALRAFNRFYTRRIGVIADKPLGGRFSLAQTRVLWELAHGGELTATTLSATLGLDAGYVSRLLAGLRSSGLVKATRSASDGRRALLTLTAAGRRAFGPLERRSQQQMAELLSPLATDEQQQLLAATGTLTRLLQDPAPARALLLRAPVPGDIGWVIERHGALYAQEYGWDQRFEAMVARIAAQFIERFDASREACWIAERDGARLGCVFLVQARDEASGEPHHGVAQLRMLLLEPAARGSGLGRRLVDECERFARATGYRRIRLWTNSVLVAARAIYQKAGYRLIATEPHASFGQPMVGETWELDLQPHTSAR